MTDSPELVDLVAAAATGDQHAWDSLVERFLPLVRSVVRSFRFSPADGDDVAQVVWLRLVEHLAQIRDPMALPGWISTTTRRECVSLVRLRIRTRANTYSDEVVDRAAIDTDVDPVEQLFHEQRKQALLEGFAELSDRHRELLLLLLADPPVSYDEISARLGIAKGSIGPTRARALQRLRESRSLAAFLDTTAECPR